MDDMGNPMPKETSHHPKSQKFIQNSTTLNERAPDTRCQRGYRTIHDFSLLPLLPRRRRLLSPPMSWELIDDPTVSTFTQSVRSLDPMATDPFKQSPSNQSIKQTSEQGDRQRGDRYNIAKHRQYRTWQQSKVQVRTS